MKSGFDDDEQRKIKDLLANGYNQTKTNAFVPPQPGPEVKFTPQVSNYNLVNLNNLGGIQQNKRQPILGDPFAEALENNIKTFDI